MKTFKLLILALIASLASFAQLENANWCFHTNARVDFNPPNPAPSWSASTAIGSFTIAGNSVSVSDATGGLLFYSDGIRVWNKNHNVMLNGDNIGGGTDAPSGRQSTVIIPKPNSPYLYYIFTANKINPGSPQNPGHNGGLHYVIVDMNPAINNGLGEVRLLPGGVGLLKTTLKNNYGELIDYDYTNNSGLQIFESRITSTPNCDGTKIWLSFFTRFYHNGVLERWALQYLVGDNGIGLNNDPDGTAPSPNTSYRLNDSNFPVPGGWSFSGGIKFTPDGKFLCDANSSSVMLYEFDNDLGKIKPPNATYPRNIYSYTSIPTLPGLGVEFSPNSQVLYFSTLDDKIYQEGLSQFSKPVIKKYVRIRQLGFLTDDTVKIIGEWEIPADTISSDQGLTPIDARGFNGELQLAINGKIYACAVHTTAPEWGKLGVINYPNNIGAGPFPGCDYSPNGITLQGLTYHEGSLPQWVHKPLSIPRVCGLWPKVYEASNLPNYPAQYSVILSGANQNAYFSTSSTNVLNNTNHFGALPSNTNSNFLLQYDVSGNTAWSKSDLNSLTDLFVLNNGVVRARLNNVSSQYIYLDGTTGIQITGPSYLPANEKLLAESLSGTFITYNAGQINVHTPTTFTSVGSNVEQSFFNKTSDKLFIENNGSIYIYKLIGNTLQFQTSFSTNPFLNLYHVDNQDNVYLLNYQTGITALYVHDFVNNINIPATVSGFNNDCTSGHCAGPLRNGMALNANYSSDKCMVYDGLDSKLYVLDFAANSTKAIPAVGACFGISTANLGFNNCSYSIIGNNVFLSGWLLHFPGYNTATVAFQTITNISTGSSNFITKFNLDDFNFSKAPPKLLTEKTIVEQKSFAVNLSPNPASDVLTIAIKNNKVEKNLNYLYKVVITDRVRNVISQRTSSYLNISQSISNLIPGSYFLTVTNEKGEVVTQSFIKL